VLTITKLETPRIRVYEYRCDAGPSDAPFTEAHGDHSISYVRRGSFGYRSNGTLHELVAGSLLVGYPGDEFMCTHEHHACGDECLSFKFSPEAIDEIHDRRETWRIGGVPPLPEIVVAAELAQAVADGRSTIGFDEIAYMLAARFVRAVRGVKGGVSEARAVDRRRVVEIARWIETSSHEALDLDTLARSAEMSVFNFLRTFAKVLGVTPHQYLVRCRLRHAARLLTDDGSSVTQIAGAVGFEDLSNFIRTFGRAAGMSPGAYRRAARASSAPATTLRRARASFRSQPKS
jgi:AraC family transcriptional regulator